MNTNKKKGRAPGGGRKKSNVTGGPSRGNYDCPICKKSFRSDKLREHYLNQVIWDKDGYPVPTYSDQYRGATPAKKLHTEYFHKHAYTKTKHPQNRTVSNAPKNPFAAAACSNKSRPDPDCMEVIPSFETDQEIVKVSSKLHRPHTFFIGSPALCLKLDEISQGQS